MPHQPSPSPGATSPDKTALTEAEKQITLDKEIQLKELEIEENKLKTDYLIQQMKGIPLPDTTRLTFEPTATTPKFSPLLLLGGIALYFYLKKRR